MKIIEGLGPRARSLLLGGTMLVGAGVTFAVAQGRLAPRDPATLPETRGTVLQYVLAPRGEVDGLILADGTEVHVPPHLGAQLQAAVRPGDEVSVRGEKEGPVLMAGSVTGVASGRTVVDAGPPAAPPPPPPLAAAAGGQAMEEVGVVRMALHGPRGEVNGAVLQSGTIVRLPPEEAARLGEALQPGRALSVRGTGVASDAGRVIEASEAGPSMGQLTQLAIKRRPGPARP